MPRDGALPPGTIVAGRYRVLSTAGEGGMGVVYVVEHINTGGRAALKIMRGNATERSVERFRREARASGIIQSEHVVTVIDADVAPELDDAPFMVMELLRGEDLSQRLDRRERLERQETVDILSQVARGLERAHAAGVVHRDLKPQNIFLHEREDGEVMVKLVDFGISRIQPKSDGREITGLTRAEDVFGTPSWMSPEQAMSMHHAVGPATDIWAVGLIAFRMLHGDSYWGEREVPQILAALMQPEREPPSEIDPTLSAAFDHWFVKSCARDPDRRFQNAVEQVNALAVALRIDAPRLIAPAHAPAGTSFGQPTPPTDVGRPIAPPDATPATDVNHPVAIRALAKPPELIQEITLEPVTPDPSLADPFDQTDLPTNPKHFPEIASSRSQTPSPQIPVLGNVASVLVPSPADLDPLLHAPAKPRWGEKLKPHLLWILPTAIFGGVFVLGLAWILAPDPPIPAPRAAASLRPASSSVVASAPVAPESAAPVVEEVGPEVAPAPGHPAPSKPRPRRAPTPAPRRDAFDTQK